MPLKNIPVPIPGKKVTFKNVNNNIYVYYTVRAYRNEAGNPTSDEVSIGKKDIKTGMLIPNRRYFELFQKVTAGVKTNTALPIQTASYGGTYALTETALSIKLSKILESSFPEKWRQLLAIAFYMLCEGNVMMYIGDWFDETEAPFAERLDDQQCSRLFASVSYGERISFFKEWVKLRTEQEYIAYDVTSVSTYAKGIDAAEWGYNRDAEALPQINLGMFYGAQSRLPIYYDIYSGSIADKSHLNFMMTGAQKLGIFNVRFVMDRGFVTENNLKYMKEKGYLFVAAFPGHWIEVKKIIDECKNAIRKSANRLSAFEVYAMPVDIDLYGFQMRAHVYFDPEKQALDEKELFSSIERLSTDLGKINKNCGITKKYTDFFKVEREKKGKFSFTPDNEKIDGRLSRAGFFILLSNDLNLSSHDKLSVYRGKDVIEKNFDQLKNNLDFKRLRTHTNKTTEGKIFVGFLALILRSHLLKKIKNNVQTKHLTLDKTLRELRKIKYVTFDDSSRMLIPLTKLQRTILEALDISHEKMVEAFTELYTIKTCGV
jgi:transposase